MPCLSSAIAGRALVVLTLIFAGTSAYAHVNPAVSLLSPPDQSTYPVGAIIPLSATATPSEGTIIAVEFLANGEKIADGFADGQSGYVAQWSSTLTAGAYVIEAVATDSFGARGYSPRFHITLSESFSNQPPLVAILQPIDRTIVRGPGEVLIRTTARDPDGAISQIRLFANGASIGQLSSTSFDFVWSNAPMGSFSITAVATDNLSGSTTSSPTRIVIANIPAQIIRGPYLQNASPTSLSVSWRTDIPIDSALYFGTNANDLREFVHISGCRTKHSVRLCALQPDTQYFYAVGASNVLLASGADLSFITPPTWAKPTRVWVLGDSGTANFDARAVRDSYETFAGSRRTDVWLMLGDNAYEGGTDAEYQGAVFEMFPQTLRQTTLWPTIGNHDGDNAYFDIFTLPKSGEAGGVPSGTESYYSFNYGNIHFICLNAFRESRLSTGPMLRWLEEDLAQAQEDWIIAFWHHPPYSHGSHDSDREIELIEMRENAVPILEAYGVDLVLCGHSHAYERSYLLHGHYGDSTTFSFEMVVNAGGGWPEVDGPYAKSGPVGTVYVVAGSSGQHGGGTLDYPAMYTSLDQLGSMVLDVDGTQLLARFLQADGQITDSFTIEKGARIRPSLASTAGASNLLLNWSSFDTAAVLEASDSLGESAQWHAITNEPAISNHQASLSIENNESARFFRLKYPR